MAKGEKEVFEFLDYRAYLRAYYEHKKAKGPFSYRAFSRRAGLKSPNYLKLVIDGERNLTPAMAKRFASACGLRGAGARFFEDLVAFNQAKGSTDRAARYRTLSGHASFRKAQPLDLAHADYHSEWFIPAVRELAHRSDFVTDPAWIAKQLVPAITKAEAATALRVLRRLDMLLEETPGGLGPASPKDAIVSTGVQTKWVHIGTYHRTMMTRAAEAIDTIPAAQRDISSLTLCVDDGALEAIKEELHQLQRTLLALADDAKDPSQVIQIGFQLFPLSNPKAGGETP
ncbi:MAG: TIGR02147 family protein [Myxococcota bacterium]